MFFSFFLGSVFVCASDKLPVAIDGTKNASKMLQQEMQWHEARKSDEKEFFKKCGKRGPLFEREDDNKFCSDWRGKLNQETLDYYSNLS